VILTVGRWLTDERYKRDGYAHHGAAEIVTAMAGAAACGSGEGDDRNWLEDFAEENGVRIARAFFGAG